jgi:hypothetical protein
VRVKKEVTAKIGAHPQFFKSGAQKSPALAGLRLWREFCVTKIMMMIRLKTKDYAFGFPQTSENPIFRVFATKLSPALAGLINMVFGLSTMTEPRSAGF